jgi:cob(II)yrinic acid a,c-diamide reductase
LLQTKIVHPQDYRDAMAHLAGAVNIVTTDGPAGRRGVTVSAACSVSDNPATILVCLMKSHPLNGLFEANGVFALNTLAAVHQPLAEAFSGKTQLDMDERFALGNWERLATGSPVLSGAIATFDCRLIEAKDVSTHRVLFGEVTGLKAASNLAPLIYHNRAYHSL